MTATPIHPLVSEIADVHLVAKVNQLVAAVNTLNDVATPTTADE